MSSRPATDSTPAASLSGADLDRALESHRRELTGFCYRMLGAGAEAEDAVQETMVRAWRSIDGFEGRSSLRSWLYRIANNVCVDMVRSPQRRARPMEMGPSSDVAEARLGPAHPEHAFVQPVPDEQVIDLSGDPADVAAARESIRLAFVAALQHLPARQRAVLILCEVLRWQAAEVAELLDTSVASVNSALQRARATARRPTGRAARRGRRPRAPGPARPVRRRLRALRHPEPGRAATRGRRPVDAAVRPLARRAPTTWPAGSSARASSARTGGCCPYRSTARPGSATTTRSPTASGSRGPSRSSRSAGGRIVGHHNFLYPELFAAFGLPDRIQA